MLPQKYHWKHSVSVAVQGHDHVQPQHFCRPGVGDYEAQAQRQHRTQNDQQVQQLDNFRINLQTGLKLHLDYKLPLLVAWLQARTHQVFGMILQLVFTAFLVAGSVQTF